MDAVPEDPVGEPAPDEAPVSEEFPDVTDEDGDPDGVPVSDEFPELDVLDADDEADPLPEAEEVELDDELLEPFPTASICKAIAL